MMGYHIFFAWVTILWVNLPWVTTFREKNKHIFNLKIYTSSN